MFSFNNVGVSFTFQIYCSICADPGLFCSFCSEPSKMLVCLLLSRFIAVSVLSLGKCLCAFYVQGLLQYLSWAWENVDLSFTFQVYCSICVDPDLFFAVSVLSLGNCWSVFYFPCLLQRICA